jgi:hypothetical protein
MLQRITLLLVFSLSFNFLSAQTLKEFSENPQEFITQLDGYMNKNKQEKIEVQFKKFKKSFEGGTFTAPQKKELNSICNAMLAQKMQPTLFLSYITVLDNITQFEKSSIKLDEFNATCSKIIADIENRNSKNYKLFLRFAADFYKTKSIRKSTGSEWRVDAPSYELKYSNKELAIEFVSLDLYGIRKDDSIQISQTSGIYYPFTDIWKGRKGQVSWERMGMTGVIAKLGTYEFEVKKNTYTCNDAVLFYPKYFQSEPIKGIFEDRIVVKSKGSKPTYPRFLSNNKVLNIDNIGADIKYRGGFKLNGITIYGYGDKENRAEILVTSPSSGKPLLRVSSLQFVIKEDVGRIVSEGSEVSLYFGQDSIYHPSSNVRFEIADKKLTIQRGERGSDRNPFYDSYHNIRLDAEKLDWVLDTDSIVIGQKTMGVGGGNDKIAVFESLHYFDDGVYRGIQNIATTNPIAVIMAYSKQTGTDALDADGLARKINPKFDVSSINSLLYTLVAKGFIEYDKDSKTVYVQEKLRHYAKAAAKKTDYDNVNIVSKTTDTNAYLYIDEENENPFDIKDVSFVELSKVQKVSFKPMNKELLLKKNRNMEFSGKVFAGMSAFQGKDFRFNYDGFLVRMDTVRFFDLFENSGELDENDDPIAYTISSRIEKVSGDLLIDTPNNKSSKEEIAMFPSFSSKGYSYVYYDKVETLDAVYKRDSFYFQLDEFGFNNLDYYMPKDVAFKGEMYSSDIFAPFKETISLMGQDKSLGFVHDTPSDGYPTYVRESPQGKGNYTGEVNLSNAGFLGKGNVKYLAASIDSEDIIFRPKRMICSARRFNLEENRGSFPELPQVKGIDVNVNWVPYRDSMYVTPEEAPFAMYQAGLHTLDGTLILTPGGLRGNGLLDWNRASMTSQDFLFGSFSVKSDTANLVIKAKEVSTELAFDSKNLSADVDFDEGIGKFKSNSDEISTSMPYNKYKTSMNEFVWDMNNEKVEFKAQAGRMDEFLSPELDSLQFQGATAEYDIANSILNIGGVSFIKTADALVYPETGDVEIAAGGKMGTLENARILASDKTKYHAINRATVNIKGGRDYTATGFYEYNVGDKKQEIEFTNIIGAPVGKGKRTKKTLATRASGKVVTKDEFYMDHKTSFRGEIALSSEEKDLYFDGYAKLDLDFPQKNWFTVKSKADKNNLAIAYENPKNPDGEPLKTGLYIDRLTGYPYPSAMGILFARKDRALMDVTGVFKYNKKNDQFIFGDSLKLTTGSYKGNTFVVDATSNECVATGEFNIGEGVKFFQPKVAGIAKLGFVRMSKDSTGNASLGKQKLQMELMAGISYKLPDAAIKAMVKDLQQNTYDVKNIELNKTYAEMLPEVVGAFAKTEKTYKQIVGNFRSTEKVTLPNTEKHLFFFSYLPMKWNSDLNSLISRQRTAGLSQVNGQSINKMVEAYVEFRMPGNKEDGMHLYIKNPSSNGGHYYYFKYKDGILQTCSSNPLYNNAILGGKKKELEIKMGKEGVYQVEPISDVSAEMFKARIKRAW